jgi:N-formylglutamate amidohydrolase
VIIHIPHASTEIPVEVLPQFVRSREDLQAEILRSTDWLTDELFSETGGVTIRYPVSRLVADPERFSDDQDEPMAGVGRGAVYFNCTDGSPLRRTLSPTERRALLDQFYHPHHQRLAEATSLELATRRSALIVDAHSFPAQPWRIEPDRDPDRPDFCLGTDPFHTPSGLVTAAERVLRDAGFSVAINRPYAGTMIPGREYRRNPYVTGIMVELNRRIYLDEDRGRKNATFGCVKACVHTLCRTLWAWHASWVPPSSSRG